MPNLPFLKAFPAEGAWKIDSTKGTLISCQSGAAVGAVRKVQSIHGVVEHLRTMAREGAVEATQVQVFRTRSPQEAKELKGKARKRPVLFLDLGNLRPMGAALTAHLPDGTAIVSCTLNVRAPRRRRR